MEILSSITFVDSLLTMGSLSPVFRFMFSLFVLTLGVYSVLYTFKLLGYPFNIVIPYKCSNYI